MSPLVSQEEALALLSPGRRAELRARAKAATRMFVEKHFDFCAIVNAKCGKCGEDCKWCAQASRWRTGIEAYGWKGSQACANAARDSAANGVRRIGIVISGKGASDAEIDLICEALRAMRTAAPEICLCASLGILGKTALSKLAAAGLQRVHCNIETAPSLFPSLCSTHTIEEKLATLRAARELGLQICCGGIIGMGESDAQLVEFAFTLSRINPDSIPVNVLHPIEGTPLGGRGILAPDRVVDSVAILRLVNPSTPLRFAGGRRDMSDETAAMCIEVGMSAGIAGPLLTTPGADYNDDRSLAVKAGYSC